MEDELDRSRIARAAAEAALVRVVHHYGARPEFVVLGGLVPELLCSNSGVLHAGTTDVDVQVDLEIKCGVVAFVLLHNDAGGPRAAALAVRAAFPDDLVGSVRTALDDLAANFARPGDQGPQAYASQMLVDHRDLDGPTLQADAALAVGEFYETLISRY